jgi:branched-chain amino acid transport system permease protein
MSVARAAARDTIVAVAAGVLLAVLPFVAPSYVVSELTYVGAYAIALAGLVIVTGYAGQISLGHGAFAAIGAYTVAMLAHTTGAAPIAWLPVAALLCAVLGAIFGAIAARLTGIGVALATFALAVSVPPLLVRFRAATGGAQGLALPPPAAVAWVHGGGDAALYGATWCLVGVAFAIAAVVLRGRAGRTLRALRDSDVAAISLGIDPLPWRILAFAWSAAYAGVAGALLAAATAYVAPSAYGSALSLTLFAAAVIGGIDVLWGAIAGAVLVEFLPLWTQAAPPAASSIVYGLALIVGVLCAPAGIAGTIGRAASRFRRPAA